MRRGFPYASQCRSACRVTLYLLNRISTHFSPAWNSMREPLRGIHVYLYWKYKAGQKLSSNKRDKIVYTILNRKKTTFVTVGPLRNGHFPTSKMGIIRINGINQKSKTIPIPHLRTGTLLYQLGRAKVDSQGYGQGQKEWK